MGRLYQSGFELADLSSGSPDGTASNNNGISTELPRTGARSYKANNSTVLVEITLSATQAKAWVRVYIRFPTTPSSNGHRVLSGIGSGSEVLKIELNASGELELRDLSNTLIGSASATLSTNTWHMVELEWDGTGATTVGAARLNGTQFASGTGSGASGLSLGSIKLAQASSVTQFVYYDDVAINGTGGTVNNSWPGDGKVVLLVPASDGGGNGSWTGGEGSTSNIYQAVDNAPPIGTNSETDSTQIEDSQGANVAYLPNTQTYSAAGIGQSDVINALIGFCCHGEDISTQTKSGTFKLNSNPDGSAGAVSFDFGNNAGALGVYPSNWAWARTAMIDQPSLTLGSALQFSLLKTSGGTRTASCCFLGAYVDYTPAAVVSLPPVRSGLHPALLAM